MLTCFRINPLKVKSLKAFDIGIMKPEIITLDENCKDTYL